MCAYVVKSGVQEQRTNNQEQRTNNKKMSVIKIENLWKEYRLGVIGHGTLTHDLQSWWAKVRGKEDPNAKISLLAGQEKQIEGDHFWALRGINLEVKQGEILGIIGKNGAGKSTLLKILSRVTAPTRGNIKVKGRIVSLLEVGTGFHPELTGRENIFMNGAILGMSKQEIKSKLDEIIDFSGVEDFVDTPVKRYSSGMYVRLAFSVAAHLEPEVLIVDEVLAVGDADFQKKCLGKMGEVAQQGRTILFVSHNMASISILCTTGILLENGQIKRCGSIATIVEQYMMRPTNSLALKDIPDRKGNGVIRFDSAKIYSDLSKKTGGIMTGGNFYIDLNLISKNAIVSDDIVIDLRIDNVIGTRLIWLSTSRFDEWTVNDNIITFFIESLPLNEGVYYVTLYCKVKDIVSDWIQNAFTFNVKNLNANSLGKIVDPSQASFIVHSKLL